MARLAMVEAAALEVTAIDKSFGPSRVLRDVNLRVETGEVHALLGENGAGKSTLIRIIAGVLHPDRGTVTVLDNLDVTTAGDPPAAARLHREGRDHSGVV